MSTSRPRQQTLTQEQIREFESGAGYDQTPRFIMRFSDAIGSVEGRILRYLAHRTLGYGQYATVVSTRDLAAVAGTKDIGMAMNWLESHGIVGRELITHHAHRTFAYWIHTDYTAWEIPDQVWRKMLALREQGCWDDPRFSADQLETLDRGRMIRISPKAGYDVTALQEHIRGLARTEREAAARPDIGAGAPNERGGPAPNNGAVPAPSAGAVSPQYRGTSAPNSGAVQVASAPEPQGLVPSGKTFEKTERIPLRGGDRRQAAPPAVGKSKSRSGTASPSLDAPATTMPTCDGERTACHPPAAGGETNGGPPGAGNGGRSTERPQDYDPVERARRTSDFLHLRVMARQMHRLGWIAIREFDEGRLDLHGHPLDPGFQRLMLDIPRRIIERYETETLRLPEDLRTSEDEYMELMYYVRDGEPRGETVDSTPPGRFHPFHHRPGHATAEEREIWSAMIRTFEVLQSHWFERILRSEELGALEVPGAPTVPTGRLDTSRILAPPPEDSMARRLPLTHDLHHLRVIARQLERLRGPVVTHLSDEVERAGGAVGPEVLVAVCNLQRHLAVSLIPRYEADVLGLPEDLRTTGDEVLAVARRTSTAPGPDGRAVPWRYNTRLHPPSYSEPEDREVWERYLTLIPDDLPDWFVTLVRSPEICTLERPPSKSRRGGGGGFRADDCETEPYGTEEDGPQPP